MAALVLESLNFFRESFVSPGQNATKPTLSETVILNEVMTENYRLHYDKTGATSDWVEIKNVGAEDIQMKGYGLSDSPEKPFKFRFPEIVIPAGGYLVVRASGLKSEFVNELHAPFKLKETGESLVLTSRDGITLDAVKIPSLAQNKSYGRNYYTPKEWGEMGEPSPGALNTGVRIGNAALAPLAADRPSGPCPAEFTLALSSSDAGVEIHYTLDGGLPDLASPRYESPLALSRSSIPKESLSSVKDITDGYMPPAEKTHRALIVRARAFSAGAAPSEHFSRVYFFDEELSSHTIAVLNITADPDDLMDKEKGIYVLGDVFSAWRKAYPSRNFQGDSPANYNRRGKAWHIPAEIEFFEKGSCFSSKVEMSLLGGWSRANPQKSLLLAFRDSEGESQPIDYELFPGLLSRDGKKRKVNRFGSIILRNGGNDWQFTLFRDAMVSELLDSFPLDKQDWRPMAVYLNGEYWGLLEMREAFDDEYFQTHYETPEGSVSMLEGLTLAGGTVKLGKEESLTEYNALVSAIEAADFSKTDALSLFDRTIDFRNHALYTAVQTWIANGDWPGNNIRFWKSDAYDGKFRWMLYDTEFSFNIYDNYQHNKNMFETITQVDGPEWPNPPWSTLMFRKFTANAEYNRYLINACCDLMNTVLNGTSVKNAVAALAAAYRSEIPLHQERWPSAAGGSIERWEWFMTRIIDFAENRNPVFKEHMQNFFSLGAPVTMRVSTRKGGTVRLNYLTLSEENFTGEYYQGINVDLAAIPNPGWVFTGWEGSVTSQEPVLSIDPAKASNLKATWRRTQ